MAHKVLVVDDDSTNRNLVCSLVSSLGHSVVGQADDGYRGLDSFRGRNPTIVLLDIVMPGLDGLAVLSQIQAAGRRAKVVMMTGAAGDTSTVRQCLEMGAVDFLIKPITKDRLEACLCRIPEPWEEQSKELGKVCCVGYNPCAEERQIVTSSRMGYLLYPTCHLAIQFFRDKLRPDSNMVILIVQEGLSMYASRDQRQAPALYEKKTGLDPWKKVIAEAQKTYMRFWGAAIKHKLLPPVVPCMVQSRGSSVPTFMDPSDVLSFVDDPEMIEQIMGDGDMNIEPLGDPGKAVEWNKVAEKMRVRLSTIETKQPQLLKPSNMSAKQEPEIKRQRVIDTRPVKIVPDSLRQSLDSRMTIRKE